MSSVYVLRDPDTNRIRYVGKTDVSLFDRLQNHITTARTAKPQSPVQQWVNELAAQGKKPSIDLVCTYPGDRCGTEDQIIAFLRKDHPDLLNRTYRDGFAITLGGNLSLAEVFGHDRSQRRGVNGRLIGRPKKDLEAVRGLPMGRPPKP